MENMTPIQEMNEAAVAVQDDPACQASPNELLPQATPAITAIGPTVRKQSSLTFDGVELTDPVEMDNDQLADIVIGGVKKFWRIVPYIITLKHVADIVHVHPEHVEQFLKDRTVGGAA